MVKHIVLFQLKDSISQVDKEKIAQQFKEAIEALPAVIPFIRSIEVGLNINTEEKWDIALYSEFDSLEDVKKYAVHPEHVKAGKLLAEVKKDRACVDYTSV
ncbi:MAG: Dabb family protein [Bacteroides sp.]|nr:Dabb family protein [Bacteroides sp.]MDD4054949.1 Dabb family protein [Bacteroides sp.]MDD4720702.1 Dabb family protein [Bacteroides sp.]